MRTTFKSFYQNKLLRESDDMQVYKLVCNNTEEMCQDSSVSRAGILIKGNQLIGLKNELIKVAEKYNIDPNVSVDEDYKATTMVSKLHPKEDLWKLVDKLNQRQMHYAVKITGENQNGHYNVIVIHDKMEDPRDLPKAGGHEEVPSDVESIEDENDLFYLHWPE